MYKHGQHTLWCQSFSFSILKVKVKWSRYRPGVAQRVGRGIALLFQDRGTRRAWVVSSTPWPHFTPGKMQYPFYRRLGGPQGRSGRAENLIPTGIRSRTVQPIVSCYTDWTTQPTYLHFTVLFCEQKWQRKRTTKHHSRAKTGLHLKRCFKPVHHVAVYTYTVRRTSEMPL